MNDLMNTCARELPAGFSIEIEVEQGGYSVILYDADANRVECPSGEGNIHREVLDALETAKVVNREKPTREAKNGLLL